MAMQTMKPSLTIETLCQEAFHFAQTESHHRETSLFGVTDGKAVGTYLEHKFQRYLSAKYTYTTGSSAKGIDFPELMVDMKVTSIKQPQSSCPFRSARQKIFGLGYALLIFVYEKVDNQQTQSSILNILHTVFIEKHRTADYQTTRGIRQILENNGNTDDLVAFMHDRYLPISDIEAYRIAEELLQQPPHIGYLTISNALQWRLQYRRAIENAGAIDGIVRVL